MRRQETGIETRVSSGDVVIVSAPGKAALVYSVRYGHHLSAVPLGVCTSPRRTKATSLGVPVEVVGMSKVWASTTPAQPLE
jgi:hypothetical protein